MKKTAVLYREQGLGSNISIELQRKSCREYAEQKVWTVEQEYIAHENVSGTIDDPLLMIKQSIKNGEIDTVLVYSYFCISGSQMEIPMVIKWLINNNVKFHSVCEGSFV